MGRPHSRGALHAGGGNWLYEIDSIGLDAWTSAPLLWTVPRTMHCRTDRRNTATPLFLGNYNRIAMHTTLWKLSSCLMVQM